MSANVKMVLGTILASVGIVAALTANTVVPSSVPKDVSTTQTTVQVWVTNPDGTSEVKEEYLMESGNGGGDTKDYYTDGAGTYTVQTHLSSPSIDEWSDPIEVTIN